MAQGLEVIIDTAEKLLDFTIKFRIIGEGIKKQSLIDLTISKNITNVSFHDPLPRKMLIKEILNSNVCLVPLINNKLFLSAIPSKIFEIMACKRPIILGVKGEAEKIINDNTCGITVEPDSSEDYMNAILKYYKNKDLADKHGKNGVNYVTSYMQKDYLLSKFLKQLKTKERELFLNINI